MMAVMDEVMAERNRQDKKWGEQNHAPEWWLIILGEETGEACKARLEGNLKQFRKELIEVAAVAVATIECLDRRKGEFVDVTVLQEMMAVAVRDRDEWKARATALEATRIGNALQDANEKLDKEGE